MRRRATTAGSKGSCAAAIPRNRARAAPSKRRLNVRFGPRTMQAPLFLAMHRESIFARNQRGRGSIGFAHSDARRGKKELLDAAAKIRLILTEENIGKRRCALKTLELYSGALPNARRFSNAIHFSTFSGYSFSVLTNCIGRDKIKNSFYKKWITILHTITDQKCCNHFSVTIIPVAL